MQPRRGSIGSFVDVSGAPSVTSLSEFEDVGLEGMHSGEEEAVSSGEDSVNGAEQAAKAPARPGLPPKPQAPSPQRASPGAEPGAAADSQGFDNPLGLESLESATQKAAELASEAAKQFTSKVWFCSRDKLHETYTHTIS